MPTALAVINKLDNFKCSGICSHSLLSVFSLSKDMFNPGIMWVIYKMPHIKKESQSHKVHKAVHLRSLRLTPRIIQCHIMLGLVQAFRLLVSVLFTKFSSFNTFHHRSKDTDAKEWRKVVSGHWKNQTSVRLSILCFTLSKQRSPYEPDNAVSSTELVGTDRINQSPL